MRIDLEIEDEDDLMGPDERTLPAAAATNQTATVSHRDFDGIVFIFEDSV